MRVTTSTAVPTTSGSRSAAIEPHFYANLCRALGCEQWLAHQTDDAVQDAIRADFRAAIAARTSATSGSRSSVRPTRVCRRWRRCPSSCTTRTCGPATCSSRRCAPSTASFEQVGWVLAGMDRDQPGPVVRDATDHRHRRAVGRGRLLGRGDRGPTRRRSCGVSDRSAAGGREADRPGAVRRSGGVPGRAGLHLHDVLVGRERQPAVLGRRRRRRDHRRPDRAADDDLGVVPAAPVVARAHRARGAAAVALRPQARSSNCPKR